MCFTFFQFLSILNKIHLTLSDNSKHRLLTEYADLWDHSLIQAISSGMDGKLNGDNLDIRVESNDIRVENKSKDFHFFASNWVADRVNVRTIPEDGPLRSVHNLTADAFIPSSYEITTFKTCLKTLLARKIICYIDEFKWMKKLVPEHIPHEYQAEMSEKSSIFTLPIMLKNEASYSDCIEIMDEYVQVTSRLYTKAGRGNTYELQNISHHQRLITF